MSTHTHPEKLLTAKELVGRFGDRGVIHHEDYFRELIRACPASTRGMIEFTAAWIWWRANPSWRPFGRKAA